MRFKFDSLRRSHTLLLGCYQAVGCSIRSTVIGVCLATSDCMGNLSAVKTELD